MNIFENLLLAVPKDGDPSKTKYSIKSISDAKIIDIESNIKYQPKGIRSSAVKAGIKNFDEYDISLIVLDEIGTAAGVFTTSRSASPAVKIDRKHLSNGKAKALIVISKNANAFTPTDYEDAIKICKIISEKIAIAIEDILISCTGVIGVQLPMSKVEIGINKAIKNLEEGINNNVPVAILTTDKGPKVCSIEINGIKIVGMAKGAGMIEPNMATMLVYFFTDLEIKNEKLKEIVNKISAKTFNSISVDTDTSTSDSLIVFSTNKVNSTDDRLKDFESALAGMMLKLSHEILYQAEGATKLIEVNIYEAKTNLSAQIIAKHVLNSPLVKTAIYGSDPNWGRIAMAIGKPGQEDTTNLNLDSLIIKINNITLYSKGKSEDVNLESISKNMEFSKKIIIDVFLGEGDCSWTAWGCDLSYDYIKINADYTS